ncbi:MAG: hypothetical protein GY953_05805 [bacterium]|nr:hypothetical protein [bacterium]
MRQTQRLRGRVYAEDGAIRSVDLSPDGRYIQAADPRSWHILLLGRDLRVLACARVHAHEEPVSVDRLGASSSALAHDENWGPMFRRAVKLEIARCAALGLAFVEVGGWALSEEIRSSGEALRTALASYALARTLGGCLGVGTVTVRHSSSRILRRIGGQSLLCDGREFPRYYDPRYQCELEILRFDSRHPNPRYRPMIDSLYEHLLAAPVVSGASDLVHLRTALAGYAPLPHIAASLESRKVPA